MQPPQSVIVKQASQSVNLTSRILAQEHPPVTVPTEAYKAPARYLHWIVAALVLSTFPVGVLMVDGGFSRPIQDSLYIYHKNIGVVILLLVFLRLLYRAMNPPPPLPDSVQGMQRLAAHGTHVLLYVLLLTMTISGYVRVKAGGFPIEFFDWIPSPVPKSKPLEETAKAVHGTARFALFALILLHIGAAAFHGIVKKDGVFSRMWPGRG
jgi:cytochrome b561